MVGTMAMRTRDIQGRISLTATVSLLLLFAIFFRLGYSCLNQASFKQRPTAILEQISKATQEADDDQGFDAVPSRPLVIAVAPSYQALPPREAGNCDLQVVSRLSARAPPLSAVIPS